MLDWTKIEGFDWDEGNIIKNLIKHGVECREAEEAFLDENSLLREDPEHSTREQRSYLMGRNYQEVILTIIFTQRKNKIRIISARKANKKERGLYEQNKKV